MKPLALLKTTLLLACGLALGIWFHWNDPTPGLKHQVLSSLPRADRHATKQRR